ncbi:unnamed protein product [Heligmosomoides polygyrus]|uniref:Uncharacterized protein n=1 Tax=Heligmosomoides polygyrus TaxID=6339 RepID=A0A183FUV6_HELPZ|nr:unnamed protein product [Heligmosomoides polygyrus]
MVYSKNRHFISILVEIRAQPGVCRKSGQKRAATPGGALNATPNICPGQGELFTWTATARRKRLSTSRHIIPRSNGAGRLPVIARGIAGCLAPAHPPVALVLKTLVTVSVDVYVTEGERASYTEGDQSEESSTTNKFIGYWREGDRWLCGGSSRGLLAGVAASRAKAIWIESATLLLILKSLALDDE